MSPAARFLIAVALPLPVSLLVIGLGVPAPEYMWMLRLAVYFVAGMFLAEVLAPARQAVDSDIVSDPSNVAWATVALTLLGVVVVGIVAAGLLIDVNAYGLLAWIAVPVAHLRRVDCVAHIPSGGARVKPRSLA